MKVIDLLNKIANGEEIPKRIKFYQTYYTWYDNGYSKGYAKEPVAADGNAFLEINTKYDLFKEIEIIEEQPELNIQEIKEISEQSEFGKGTVDLRALRINELIRAVKQLDNKMKGE